MKKVLITGALGFVGSNLAKYLTRKGLHVTGCDDLSFGSKENEVVGVTYHYKSFEEYNTMDLSKYDIVIHAATCNIIYSQLNPTRSIQVNDVSTAELFSRIGPSTYIIYLSTASVYGNQEPQPLKEISDINLTNVYATGKYAAELHLKSLHRNYTILRLSNVYGPNQLPENPYCGVIGKLMHSMMTGEDFVVYGNGEATRDYTYVEDVCKAVGATLAARDRAKGKTFNISTTREYNVWQLLQYAMHVPGVKPFNARQEPERGIDTVQRRCLDAQWAKECIGWSNKTSLYDGLAKTFTWFELGRKKNIFEDAEKL